MATVANGYAPRGSSRSFWPWILVGVFGFLCFVGGILGFVFWIMHHSEAEKLALAKANASSVVTGSVGEPVKAGIFITGSVDENSASGHADLVIPVEGPKGKGKLYVVGVKSTGQWQLTEAYFVKDGSSVLIDFSN